MGYLPLNRDSLLFHLIQQRYERGAMIRQAWMHSRNTVAESFFQRLKREQIRRQTYNTRGAATCGEFKYIELLYNSKQKHTNNGMLSPVDFKTRQ